MTMEPVGGGGDGCIIAFRAIKNEKGCTLIGFGGIAEEWELISSVILFPPMGNDSYCLVEKVSTRRRRVWN